MVTNRPVGPPQYGAALEEIAIFEVLRRHLFLIAALSLVALLAGYGTSFLVTEKYEATATVLVRPHEPIKIDERVGSKEFLDFPVGQMAAVDTPAKTYIQIIKSSTLVGEVVRQLNLDLPAQEEPEGDAFFDRLQFQARKLYDDLEEYFNDAVALFKYGRLLKDDPFTKAVKSVSKGLALKSYEDTYVFEIEYSDKKPRTAAAVANTTANLFIAFMEKMRSAEAKYAGDRLQKELEQSRKRLVAAREELQNYKTSHQVFLYKSEYEAKLKVISDLEVELAKLEESLAATPGTLAAQTYAARRARVLDILRQRRSELAGLPEIERELQLRQADVDVAATAYDTVSKDLKDAEIKRSDPVPEARLISQAMVPRLPSRPRRDIISLAALLSGLLAGIVLAFFLEYVNRRVRSLRDVEDLVGLNVLATIPESPRPLWPSTEPSS
jgi:uncharacterized protein involved in exopolysaccharide biosynthesis